MTVTGNLRIFVTSETNKIIRSHKHVPNVTNTREEIKTHFNITQYITFICSQQIFEEKKNNIITNPFPTPKTGLGFS